MKPTFGDLDDHQRRALRLMYQRKETEEASENIFAKVVGAIRFFAGKCRAGYRSIVNGKKLR